MSWYRHCLAAPALALALVAAGCGGQGNRDITITYTKFDAISGFVSNGYPLIGGVFLKTSPTALQLTAPHYDPALIPTTGQWGTNGMMDYLGNYAITAVTPVNAFPETVTAAIVKAPTPSGESLYSYWNPASANPPFGPVPRGEVVADITLNVGYQFPMFTIKNNNWRGVAHINPFTNMAMYLAASDYNALPENIYVGTTYPPITYGDLGPAFRGWVSKMMTEMAPLFAPFGLTGKDFVAGMDAYSFDNLLRKITVSITVNNNLLEQITITNNQPTSPSYQGIIVLANRANNFSLVPLGNYPTP